MNLLQKHLLFWITQFICVVSLNAQYTSVTIDSLSGKAEIQRSGKRDWSYVTGGEKINHNDIIRVLNKSFARLKWPDGSDGYVHQNSQILINLTDNKPKHILNHTTIFFGAVFFVIKNILPHELISETRIYTPTTIISLRGTSFFVNVPKDSNFTTIKMINGTIEVKNIKNNVQKFLSAPYQTRIYSKTNPITQTAVLQADLDSLKEWIPELLIESEIASHLEKSKRNHLIISGRIEDRCLIAPFIDSSDYKGNWDIKRSIQNFLTEKLKTGNDRLKIEKIDSIPNNLDVIAQDSNIRYLVKGTINSFEIAEHAKISTQADDYKEFRIGRVNITIEFINLFSEEGFTETFTGEITQKRKTENAWVTIQALKFDLNDAAFSKSILGLTINQCLDQIVEKVYGGIGM
jgi:hypothetical protein